MMATKKKRSSHNQPNHLASHDSFQFAMHAAILVVLIGILINMVGSMTQQTQAPQGQTAGITTTR